MDNKVYRFYLISINLGLIHYKTNSRTYKLPRKFFPYLIGFFYTIMTLLTGFISISMFFKRTGLINSFEAIQYNLSGGVDFTTDIDDRKYDHRTHYVFNNTLRRTKNIIKKSEIEIIIEIYDQYYENEDTYKNDIEAYIISNLKKVDIRHLSKVEISDIVVAIVMYENSVE